MSARRRKPAIPRAQLQIAPMIDVVFLLLIYFMVSASLARQEADLSFQLPGSLIQSTPLDIPDEPIIVIAADGQVSVNDYPYDTPDAAALPELSHMLKRYHHSCQGNRVTASVTLAPAAAVRQQRIVEVMDACAQAGISGLSFASDRE